MEVESLWECQTLFCCHPILFIFRQTYQILARYSCSVSTDDFCWRVRHHRQYGKKRRLSFSHGTSFLERQTIIGKGVSATTKLPKPTRSVVWRGTGHILFIKLIVLSFIRRFTCFMSERISFFVCTRLRARLFLKSCLVSEVVYYWQYRIF